MIENIGAYSQVDYDRGYQQGRADAIEEFCEKLLDKAVEDSFLVEVNGIATDCMTVDYLADLVTEVAEQLKEQ